MARCLSPRAWRWPLALVLMMAVHSAAPAQFGGMGRGGSSSGGRGQPFSPGGFGGGMGGMVMFGGPAIDARIYLKQPVASQVFQRDRDNLATISIVLDDTVKDAQIVGATLHSTNPKAGLERVQFAEGKLWGVPVGGPYTLQCQLSVGEKEAAHTVNVGVSPIFVGDLWVLAGQSNMQGVGELIDVTPPNPNVLALGMDGEWVEAEEPLHWLVDSPDSVHSGDPKTQEKRSEEEHKNRTTGAGLGLPFATLMVEKTKVPIGLVICAHGGTSMEQWNPSKKKERGASLYGSMLRQVKLAGGKVAGVLWYQGESDAIGGAADVFPKVFADFIAAVRSDFNSPGLPFYYVQIGRFINVADPKGWNKVQDAQRKLADQIQNTAVISVIDLELDDLIHVGTQGLKRAGRRLALIALREQFGQDGATTPTLDRVLRGPANSLTVKFKGVNISASQPSSAGVGLRPKRHVAGFSIRKEDGAEIPLIFEATVGNGKDSVILKLAGPIPPKSSLWYGHGLAPFCNLTDSADMAVPVFGPIPLDDVK